MKILLVLVAVYALVWLLRRSLTGGAPKPPVSPRVAPPQAMLVCAECGLHLPSDEAVPGRGGGVFCSEPHRVAFERSHPGR